MDYLNLHTSVIDSEQFLTATGAQRGTWLCLYRYCAGQENGGRIEACKGWPDRVWLQICKISSREVSATCGLWSWQDDTLIVTFYNAKTEERVQRLRGQAANAAHSRWHLSSMPHGMPSGITDGIQTGNASSITDGNAKGKGRERKGKEGKGNIPVDANGQGQLSIPQANGHRKPKPGSVIPAEQPDVIAARMVMVGALKGRLANTPWSAKEVEAFTAARLDTCAADDFAAQIEVMRGYYSAKIPHETDFRRRELLTLLNNWSGELDKARGYNRDNNDGYTKAS